MNRIRRLLGDRAGLFDRYVAWAVAYGLLRGLAVGAIVPIVEALVTGDDGAFRRWMIVLVAATALCLVAHYVQAMAGFAVAIHVLRHLQKQLGDHVVSLPLGWFTGGRAAQVAMLATSGTMTLASAGAHLMTPVFAGVASAAAVVLVALVVQWQVGVALLICAPLVWAVQTYAVRFADAADHRMHAATHEVDRHVLEFARCQPALRAAGRSAHYAPLTDAITRGAALRRRLLWRQVIGLAMGAVAVQAALSGGITVCAFLALGGTLSPGRFVGLVALCLCFVQPLFTALEYASGVRAALLQLGRFDEVFATRPLAAPQRPLAPTTPGDIRFEGVTFGYDGEPVIRDLDLHVAPGETVALVGPSGSGKTTLTKLIARFHEVDAGAVSVGGVDVREQATADLMAQLSLVFQDVYLFDDTLEANIRLGRLDATEAEVREAARLAGVLEIVDRLPHGWDTRVGEAGAALSGGERQRVSIARALLKNAPIVLLDEATAALDPENEHHVGEAMEALGRGTTVLVIAHKLTTVVGADRIVVLTADGRIDDVGTHAELLGRCAAYASFWRERERARGWRIAAPA